MREKFEANKNVVTSESSYKITSISFCCLICSFCIRYRAVNFMISYEMDRINLNNVVMQDVARPGHEVLNI